MATFGTVIEVLEVAEDWPEYEEKLGHFFGANGITEEAKKCSILLSVCRAKNYKLIRNLAAPRKPGNIPYDELVKLVGNHYNPKPSVIVQRWLTDTYPAPRTPSSQRRIQPGLLLQMGERHGSFWNRHGRHGSFWISHGSFWISHGRHGSFWISHGRAGSY
ncbi:uncharacterized protein [Mobula birostris]|uniref:uncharacterized protein isoform X11 n=1 Tax=Mobula birostris TaxID=1983395 RepID=UPI003B27BA4A